MQGDESRQLKRKTKMRPPQKYDNSDIPEDIPEELESSLEDAAELTSSNAKTPVSRSFIEDLKALARK